MGFPLNHHIQTDSGPIRLMGYVPPYTGKPQSASKIIKTEGVEESGGTACVVNGDEFLSLYSDPIAPSPRISIVLPVLLCCHALFFPVSAILRT